MFNASYGWLLDHNCVIFNSFNHNAYWHWTLSENCTRLTYIVYCLDIIEQCSMFCKPQFCHTCNYRSSSAWDDMFASYWLSVIHICNRVGNITICIQYCVTTTIMLHSIDLATVKEDVHKKYISHVKFTSMWFIILSQVIDNSMGCVWCYFLSFKILSRTAIFTIIVFRNISFNLEKKNK